MILIELYRYQERWKFRAVGQGFAAGLPALAAHFGLDLPETARERPAAGGTEQRREPVSYTHLDVYKRQHPGRGYSRRTPG